MLIVKHVVGVFVLGVLAATCRVEGRQLNPETTPQPQTAVSQQERAQQFFNSVIDKDFTSIAEAESVAGYHIPRPGPAYPMGFNQTTLRSFKGDRRPVSITEYTYTPMAPTSIDVTVGPAYDWDQKDGTKGDQVLSYGTPTAIASATGWLTDSGGAFKFHFQCGAVDGVAVWCNVTTTDKIGREAFDKFVSSIQ